MQTKIVRSHLSQFLFSSVALATALPLPRAGAAEILKQLPCRDGLPDEDVIAKATKGNVRARLSLAYRYRDGKGVQKDYAEAMRWAHLAADRGDAAAMDFVGWMFFEGLGVKRNPTVAAGYFKAAAGESAAAAWNLGQCYFGSQGVEHDVPKALEVWKKAAAMGHGRAASTAAMVYLAGEGVTPDLAEARRLATRAAELNDPSGLVVLGEIQFQAGEIEQARENWTKVSQMKPTGRTGHPEQPSDNMAAQQGADLLKLMDYRRGKPEPGRFALVAMPHIHQGWNNCGAHELRDARPLAGQEARRLGFQTALPVAPRHRHGLGRPPQSVGEDRPALEARHVHARRCRIRQSHNLRTW